MKRILGLLVSLVLLGALIAAVVLQRYTGEMTAEGVSVWQTILAQSARTQFLPALLAVFSGLGWGWLAFVFILGLIFFGGPLYCRYLCPLGMVQAVVRAVFRYRARRVCTRLPVSRGQLIFRWSIVTLCLIAGFLGYGFGWLDPYGIFLRFVQVLTVGFSLPMSVLIVSVGVFALVLLLAVLPSGRIWCTWICPVGTMLAAFARFSRRPDVYCTADGCKSCGLCLKKQSSVKSSVEAEAVEGGVTRRNFLAGAGATVGVLSSEKIVDGGFADVTVPGIPNRAHAILPPTALSSASFAKRCVACQLCVTACPEKVLRARTDGKGFLLPEMGFEKGWCRPECTACTSVCPTLALKPLTIEAKRHVHVGVARLQMSNCLAVTRDEVCSACFRNCPQKAIYLVPKDPAKPQGVRIPYVNGDACIGCGACEHVCPARPMPGMIVEGLQQPRAVVPMSCEDALAQAVTLVKQSKAAVMAIQEGVIVAHADGRGVAPLLSLLDDEPFALRGATVVDKVIGRAAAAVCVCAGVKRVHALLLSEEAEAFLKKQGVEVSAVERVPQILNRKRSGLCPLEQAVKGQDDPVKMLALVRRKVKALRAASAKKESK